MPKDAQLKKAKASNIDLKAEKTKKSKNTSTEIPNHSAKKRKATEDAVPIQTKKLKAPSDAQHKKAKITTNDSPEIEISKQEASIPMKSALKKSSKTNGGVPVIPTQPEKAASKTDKALGKTINNANRIAQENFEGDSNEVDEAPRDSADSASESEIDQTQALLQGFDTDDDEIENLAIEGLPLGQEVPKRIALSKKEEKKLQAIADTGDASKPGVVYIGRIPHGFFEHEMKEYFTQFGNILKLRLARNKKTGASKHRGWIQFESAEVANIVAKAMDNYLMFGHLLKVNVVPEEQVHAALFKGANKRFKAVPWNKIEGRKLAQGASEGTWDKRHEKEQQRREGKAAKLKQIGYEFDSPKLKSASSVLKGRRGILEEAAESPIEPEAAPLLEGTQPPAKKAKTKKRKSTD